MKADQLQEARVDAAPRAGVAPAARVLIRFFSNHSIGLVGRQLVDRRSG